MCLVVLRVGERSMCMRGKKQSQRWPWHSEAGRLRHNQSGAFQKRGKNRQTLFDVLGAHSNLVAEGAWRGDPSHSLRKNLVECIPLSLPLIQAPSVEYTDKADLPAGFNGQVSETEIWKQSGGQWPGTLQRLGSVRVTGHSIGTHAQTCS